MPSAALGRLRKGAEFDTAYSQGTATSGPFFVIRVRVNGLGKNRFGFAVGKRLLPLATRRNLIKRRVREAVRRVEVSAGHDVIVAPRQRAVDASFAELSRALEDELGRALRRAGAE